MNSYKLHFRDSDGKLKQHYYLDCSRTDKAKKVCKFRREKEGRCTAARLPGKFIPSLLFPHGHPSRFQGPSSSNGSLIRLSSSTSSSGYERAYNPLKLLIIACNIAFKYKSTWSALHMSDGNKNYTDKAELRKTLYIKDHRICELLYNQQLKINFYADQV